MVLGLLALLAALLLGIRHAAQEAEPVPVRVPADTRYSLASRARR